MIAGARSLRLRALAVGAAMAIVAGCSTGPAASALVTPSPAPAASPTARATIAQIEVRFDEDLVLADGRELSARCIGTGTPTILLEVGGSNDMTDWSNTFVTSLGAVTTTCLYSRAGGPGSSPPSVNPPTMESVTSDAFELLELAQARAGVEGPYVFVGWSLGGSVALAEALTRPDQTVGVAILDTGFPQDFLKVCAESGRSKADCRAEYDADIQAKLMETQIADAVHPLDIPAVLVTAMAYPDCFVSPEATLSADLGGEIIVVGTCAELAARIADKQFAGWQRAFPEIEQTRVDADHDGMVSTAAAQIAGLILAIVEEARTQG